MSHNEWMEIAVDDGTTMRAYVARPNGSGPHKAMLVFQEALGVNEQLKGVAEQWAAQGFIAIAPELFHRFAPGYATDTFDMAEVMSLVKQLTIDGFERDVRATYAWAAAQPDIDVAQICAMGFCMGGRAAYVANAELPLAAAISYYAGGVAPALLDRAPRLHGPHLFFWGGLDPTIPPEQHRAIADALRAAGKRFVNVEFSDANHGFFNERVEGRHEPRARAQSWALAVAFLEQNL